MRCSRCRQDNPPRMKFCGECAAPLASVCAACGAANPAENKFCGQCAAPLRAAADKLPRPGPTPPSASPRILTSKSALEGERSATDRRAARRLETPHTHHEPSPLAHQIRGEYERAVELATDNAQRSRKTPGMCSRIVGHLGAALGRRGARARSTSTRFPQDLLLTTPQVVLHCNHADVQSLSIEGASSTRGTLTAGDSVLARAKKD